MGGQNKANKQLLPPHVQRKMLVRQLPYTHQSKIKDDIRSLIASPLILRPLYKDDFGSGRIIPSSLNLGISWGDCKVQA
jgi:hypothetical protein